MKNKKVEWFFLISIGIILFLLLFGPVLLVLYAFNQNPPKPSNMEGTFPFELVYEINEEKIAIKDSLFIKYGGVEWREGIKCHKWNWEYLSGRSIAEEKMLVNIYTGVDSSGREISIDLDLGSCEYYMGVEECDTSLIKPGDIVISYEEIRRSISEQKLLEDFGIRIIQKKISEPQNHKTGDGSLSSCLP